MITITPEEGERYQGVVGLEGDTLAACTEDYFLRSEQLPTRLFIRTGVDGKPAAGECCSGDAAQERAGGGFRPSGHVDGNH